MFDCYYAFTVKRNCKNIYPSEDDYHVWMFNACEHRCDIIDYVFELDSKDKLHVHGILKAPYDLRYKDLLIKGMHQKIVQLICAEDYCNFCNYIWKDYDSRIEHEQMLDRYYCWHNYAYI